MLTKIVKDLIEVVLTDLEQNKFLNDKFIQIQKPKA